MGVALSLFLTAFAASPGDTLVLPQARALRDTAPSDPSRQVISEYDLRRSPNLADALKSVPGFRVRAQAGLGGYAETWFRGTDARQIAVYLDDIPLTSSLEPAADLGRMPALMIAGMEVDKGAAGGDPEGAAASIRLSSFATGNLPVTVTGRVSSFGGREAALAAKTGSGPRGLYLSAGAAAARNDYPYPSDNGTGFNGGDDGRPVMENNGYYGGFFNLAWREQGESGSFRALGVSAGAYRKRYPGLFAASPRAYTDREDLALHGGFDRERPGAFLRAFSGAATARFSADAYRDPGKTLGYRSFALDRSLGFYSASLGLTARAPAAFFLDLGSRADYEESDSRAAEGFQPYSAPDAKRISAEPYARLRRSWGAFSAAAEGLVEWAHEESEKVIGSISEPRPQPFNRDAVGSTRRLSLGWDAGAFGRWTAEGQRLQRLPSLFERLGDNNGIQKNLDLEPQEVEGYSLAGEITAGPARLIGGPFLQINRKPIRLAPLGGGSFLRFVNGADYSSLGWETRCDAGGARWHAGEAVTLALPRILAGRGSLSGNAPAYASAVESLAEASLSPLPGAWIDIDWEYRTAYYPSDLDLAGTRRSPESLLGLGLRWGKRRIEAAARADNITDENYQDFAYSPKSGRRFSFQVSIKP
jgi:hypothetical protein